MRAVAEPVVAIVGAGPAGVRAAETLARGCVRPILFDEGERPGGQIYRQPPRGAGRAAAELYGLEAAKAAAIHRVLPDLADRVDYRPQTLVWNLFQSQLDLLGPDGYGEQRFDRLILVTGAMDRALPFPGWSAPGRCCRSSRINMPRPARGSSPCSMRRLSLRRSRSCPG